MSGLRSILDVILDITGQPPMPEGWDTWGWKTVRPDLRSRDGFRWPWPGGIAEVTPAPASKGACAAGLHIALSARGAAAGGHGHETILLVAYRAADVVTGDADKCRVPCALVADVVDGRRVWRSCAGADLAGAYLTGAYLAGACLTGANLADAYLADAYLAGANLADAYLTGADLTGADLTGADLTGAYLTGADLTGANLARANLADAYLAGAIGYVP